MTKRNALRRQLASAWIETICEQYRHQLINSERGLQVYFCLALQKQFGGNVSRKLFIEPSIRLGDEVRYPDLVICNSRAIIGVVELKYLPRVAPKFNKDIDTLRRVAEQGRQLTIENKRFFGKKSAPLSYTLSEDAVLCWAGIYKCHANAGHAKPKVPEALSGRYLQLDALTSADQDPRVWIRGKEIPPKRHHVAADADLTIRSI